MKCVEQAEVWAISSAAIADVCHSNALLASRLFASIAAMLASRLYVALADWHAAAAHDEPTLRVPHTLEKVSLFWVFGSLIVI